MFDFQKYRNNQPFTERFDHQCLGRVMRLKDEPPVAIIATSPEHSMALELAITESVRRKLDVVVIGDAGSSVGVSLHDDDLLAALKPVEIKPLDISQLIGRNRTQR